METLGDGIGSGGESEKERDEEAEEAAALLRDRLRLSVISIASSHGLFSFLVNKIFLIFHILRSITWTFMFFYIEMMCWESLDSERVVNFGAYVQRSLLCAWLKKTVKNSIRPFEI